MPRTAHWSAEHAVRLCVVDKALLSRVPFQFSAGQHGYVAEMADGGGAVPDFYVCNRVFAKLDATEKVLLMVVALV